jgi:isoquinoline 1-oxidoreductase beta subunit
MLLALALRKRPEVTGRFQSSGCSNVARLEPAARGRRLARLHVAIDAGQVVHPGTVRAQMEGGPAWTLSALKQQVRFTQGRCDARDFGDFAPLRLPAMPEVDKQIAASDAWPGGVGEKGVPGVAPAVLNAWFAASGQRVRRGPGTGNPLRP